MHEAPLTTRRGSNLTPFGGVPERTSRPATLRSGPACLVKPLLQRDHALSCIISWGRYPTMSAERCGRNDMSRSVPLHPPEPFGNFNRTPGGPPEVWAALAPTRGAPLQPTEAAVAAKLQTKIEAVSVKPRWGSGWIALGFAATSLIVTAIVILAPAFQQSIGLFKHNIQQAASVEVSSNQAAGMTPSAAPDRQNETEFQKVVGLTSARPSDAVFLARPSVNEVFAWPPVIPRTPFLSKMLENNDRRVAKVDYEKDTSAAEKESLKREQDSESTPQTFAPGTQPKTADMPDRASLASQTLPQKISPRVLIRFAKHSNQSRRRAEDLVSALIKEGIEVADLQMSSSPLQTALSFYYIPDKAVAQRVGRLAQIQPVRRSPARNGLQLSPGLIDITFNGD